MSMCFPRLRYPTAKTATTAGRLQRGILSVALACLGLMAGGLRAGTHPVMESARQRLAAFHEGAAPNGAFVRVVYFQAADREPLADYEGRLDRVMTDISAFYREEMEQRFSVEMAGLPLERQDGKLVIHRVRGRHPSAHYQHESGDETWGEVKAALAGTLNPDREHVLILYGLCEREENGRYVFSAPYYGAGWSDQRRGLCHAADCERLDPALLTAREERFVFKEHYYERMMMSVAQFNSWYLGGIAHELGHGLGFPHDNGGPGEASGVALMGGGNLHYREDRWGGTRPAYLSLATALRLAAHPLTTQSDKGRWQEAEATFDALEAQTEKGTLRLSGKVRASVPPCAVIASVWPKTARSDHGAMTFCSAVDDEGRFALELTSLKESEWHLHLGALLANGAESTERLAFHCDETGIPDAADLLATRASMAAEQAFMRDPVKAQALWTSDAIAAAPNDETRRRLRILSSFSQPPPEPVDLTQTERTRVPLSDAQWAKAEVGWGEVTRNRFWFQPSRWEGVFLQLKDQVYEKGLYAHADSSFVFPLAGRWKTFSATIGLRDGAARQGSAIFTVIGDGKELYRSKVLRAGQKEDLRLEIAGIQQLELRAQGGEGHNHNSWAIWCAPVAER